MWPRKHRKSPFEAVSRCIIGHISGSKGLGEEGRLEDPHAGHGAFGVEVDVYALARAHMTQMSVLDGGAFELQSLALIGQYRTRTSGLVIGFDGRLHAFTLSGMFAVGRQ